MITRATKYTNLLLAITLIIASTTVVFAQIPPKYFISDTTFLKVSPETWKDFPTAGDTIFISSKRTESLFFENLEGSKEHPIHVVNYNGQVNIESELRYAIKFIDCKYIKISGKENSDADYGITLNSKGSGLEFGGISTNCEAEYLKIDHEGFFGIVAKKDFGANPPDPIPVFEELSIHHCMILNVVEGMYLGETKSPGMEFKHVEIYNNVVYNTGREAIQIANMVEDVKIYNNTLIRAGSNNHIYHGNILQIGDNSTAEVYNNILIGGNSYGIISFGNGENTINNNYIADCKGIFIDNRLFSNEESTIDITNNYFNNISGDEIIKSLNEVNSISITKNIYNTNIELLNSINPNLIEEESNNNLKNIKSITFEDIENLNFELTRNTSSKYKELGAFGINIIEEAKNVAKETRNAFARNSSTSTRNKSTQASNLNKKSNNSLIKSAQANKLFSINISKNDLGIVKVRFYNTRGIKVLEQSINSAFINKAEFDLSSIDNSEILIVQIQSEFGYNKSFKVSYKK